MGEKAMKGLITAGGRGTRMRPLTFSTNKHLLPIANKPLILYAVETLIKAGVREIAFNYNPGQLEELKNCLGDGSRFGTRFHFILQEKPAGLADVVRVAQEFVGGDKLVMHLGDNIFWGGIKKLVTAFEQSKKAAGLVILKHPENFRMGVPYFDKQGRLIKVVEKPRNPPHHWAIPGLYFFTPVVFGCFSGRGRIKPSARGELEITDVYNWLLNRGFAVEILEFKGVWRDPGKFDDWLATNRFVLDETVRRKIESRLGDGVVVEGRVAIGPGCRIKTSVIRGPTVIGRGVEIVDSFVGPYTSVGDGCLLEKVRIENSILVSEVEIRNITRPLDSCLIGQKTTIVGEPTTSGAIELFLGNQCQLKL